MVRKNYPYKEFKILTIGGGTGNSSLLRGLKNYTPNITTIVTVADDGGGSGVLREDMGILPPGDIRCCLIALANTEPAMEKLMDYRFTEGKLDGQSFGNLFLAAMNRIHGSFEKGLKEASNVLAITGKVLPMTLENVVLFAKLEDGSIIEGESNITFLTRKSKSNIDRVFIKPDFSKPIPEAIDEIENANIILIGPGSLYTSIMPNLLVEDIREALKTTDAKVYYICNIMTQPGETDNYSVKDHIDAIIKHCGENIIDAVLVNEEGVRKDFLLKYYYEVGAEQVILNKEEEDEIKNMEIEVIKGNFVTIKNEDLIRHDADLISKKVFENYKSGIC